MLRRVPRREAKRSLVPASGDAPSRPHGLAPASHGPSGRERRMAIPASSCSTPAGPRPPSSTWTPAPSPPGTAAWPATRGCSCRSTCRRSSSPRVATSPWCRLPSALNATDGQGPGFPAPFTAGTARPAGVHLQWAPPDALLRGRLDVTPDRNRLGLAAAARPLDRPPPPDARRGDRGVGAGLGARGRPGRAGRPRRLAGGQRRGDAGRRARRARGADRRRRRGADVGRHLRLGREPLRPPRSARRRGPAGAERRRRRRRRPTWWRAGGRTRRSTRSTPPTTPTASTSCCTRWAGARSPRGSTRPPYQRIAGRRRGQRRAAVNLDVGQPRSSSTRTTSRPRAADRRPARGRDDEPDPLDAGRQGVGRVRRPHRGGRTPRCCTAASTASRSGRSTRRSSSTTGPRPTWCASRSAATTTT